jgi:hypothetical protein
VGDVKRMLGGQINNNEKTKTMFETGTGLAGASTVHDKPRRIHARDNNMNYYYPDLPYDYEWNNMDAQAIMYNRYLAIHRSSIVIRLLLFVVLILLIVKIVKK